MTFKEYLSEKGSTKNGRYRTVNVDEDLHFFFKRTANHYDLALSNLIYNILDKWKQEYEEEIKRDMINNFNK